MKLVLWPLMSGLLHLVQRGGAWAGPQPAHGIHALLAVPVQNVTAHPSTASAPVIVLGLLCNGPLLCDVPIKGLRQKTM